ncbi:MAG: aminotransferase class IV [Gemmatimonadetes bacterium]|nr:aminotransferase class IV [Gemmatimonadota bacterium]
MQTAYFNGEYLPREEVRVSPDDRGFLFSDGVYEVLRAYRGRLFEVERHADRLTYSLDAMRIRGVTAADLVPACAELLARNDLSTADALVYLQVTRGAAPRTHRYPDPPVPPTVYACAWAFSPDHSAEDGARAITVPDQRWARCDIKTVALIPNCMANQEALDAAAAEAIFVRDGVALEGTHTNLFAVFRGRVRTAPLTNYILPGVTRAVVLELCREAGFEVAEEPIFADELYGADEVFIAGTTAEVTPIVDLDGRAVGTGRPGSFALDLLERLRERAHAG